MRRPSPLPSLSEAAPSPPPTQRAAAPQPTPGGGQEGAAPVGGAVRPSALATLVAEPPAADPALDTSSSTSDAPTPIAPVRLRDVWRAARARRRVLRAEVRRFTVRARHRRMLWIGGAASVLLLVLCTLGVAYSPLLAVEDIHVIGAERLNAAAVEDALSGELGTPLPLVDESAVKAVLVRFPLIETYSLEARPPHALVVRIVERTPIGVVSSPAGFTLVDAAGVALSTTPAAPAGQPIIDVEGGTGTAAFTAAGLVMRSLPDSIRSQVTAVAATTPDDVSLTLGATGTTVIWGSSDDSAMKGLVLETTMVARPPASVSVYDVSSPAAIVVR